MLDSESGCINLAKIAIAFFPNVREIVTNADYIKWEKKLKASGPKEYIWKDEKLNILTVSVIVGMVMQYKLRDPITEHCKGLLAKLEQYLGHFPLLKSNGSFKDKIGNLGQFNFLSTLSELSLAYYFSVSGFSVEFEKSFINLESTTRKDVDIAIKDNQGNEVYFEVYMPVSQADIEGFFSPTDGDRHYIYKVQKKLSDKFGQAGISKLSGKVILAVNTSFLDLYQVRKIVFNDSDLQQKIINNLPLGVDGIFIFEDAFGAVDSLRIEGLYLKQDDENNT